MKQNNVFGRPSPIFKQIFLIPLQPFLSAVLAAPLIFTSCGQTLQRAQETIFVRFPSIPPHVPEYARVTGWTTVYPNEDGSLAYKTKNTETDGISILVSKNALTPVLVFPLCGDTQFYKPAGTLYPAHMKSARERELQASWESGFTADFALNLLCRADQPFSRARQTAAFINWRRFDEEVRKQQNPWKLDAVKLYQSLESRKLTTRSFSRGAETAVQTALPAHMTELSPEYIAEEPLSVPANGVQMEFILIQGVNRFLCRDSIVSVFHDKNSTHTLVISEMPR